MAKHKQAAKRARQSVKRQQRNSHVESQVKNAVRSFREAVQAGDRSVAAKALTTATRQLQRAASKGVLHPRNASRRVSRLMLAANKMSEATAG